MRLSARLLSSFPALVTRGKKAPATVETLTTADLPQTSTVKASPGECDLLLDVKFSTLNYKDALTATGTYPGLRPPMVGGIDVVGVVRETGSDRFREGDEVVVNGWGVGTDHFGGFAGAARVRSDWAVKLPAGLTMVNAAKIGTAGYTAMLCVHGLVERGVAPSSGPVLVTGAPGGVGSVAILLLKSLGYEVHALGGKDAPHTDYITALGASQVLDRAEMEGAGRPLGKEKWAGGVDSCGDKILANLLSMVKYRGAVSACGLAAGMSLPTTVAPFILRGVTLVGIDSVFLPTPLRLEAYNKYAPLLTEEGLNLVCGGDNVVGLGQVVDLSNKMLAGAIRGRYVVDLSK